MGLRAEGVTGSATECGPGTTQVHVQARDETRGSGHGSDRV
ncbi:hypothetical protein Ae406Ps2_1976c [Pseudonocardia sp. Ae406_Ps2]|nr:hypothetical protein Ae406Ps2_1976c [Pseudonocardia sp. Ae406_Ps2]OLM12976.1 hypothetical protein Ae505Ps2_3104 [Pseudonocardia sp. Ae505_Ps2]OLM23553.1 hypothetical protein Ae706Ps2_1986c [Pseudonocardia sp. Ae706_Ps2]